MTTREVPLPTFPRIWIAADRMHSVMAATGCSLLDARDYLIAEEGDTWDAIASIRHDRAAAAEIVAQYEPDIPAATPRLDGKNGYR